MINQSLAVRMRPKCFAEVIGQPAIISILQRQIETGKFKHAYLFSGPSGCGKTTLARIMSSEINKHEGEPIEIDAASNNGVDNIRQLAMEAQQMSIDSDYKIYIIDECHMLTTAAWNAALKLIEEPPTHSIFIFCTTNPNKVPITILNRVQRFDFRRISSQDIADRLEFILNEEVDGATFERDALLKIAFKSDGLMREAISLLEKCLDYSNNITLDNVTKILGLPKDELLYNLLNSMLNKDLSVSFDLLNELCTTNSNYINIIDSLLSFIIDCGLIQKTKSLEYSNISKDVSNKILLIQEDLVPIVDRLFKYRQLCDGTNVQDILKIFVIEICGR